jgi:hypothetical protein
MNNIFEAAEFYISKGFKVFPVHGIHPNGQCTCGKPECNVSNALTKDKKVPVGKHPATTHGRTDAVGDIESFRKLVGARENLNIGINTGPESGMWVLDVDEEEGIKSLAELCEQNAAVHRGAWQATGQGQHWLFKYPSHLKVVTRAGQLGKDALQKLGTKLDVRGQGGYIVADPSRHFLGHQYQWHDGPLEDAPEWLVELVSDKAKEVRPDEYDYLHYDPFPEGEVFEMLDLLYPDASYDDWYQIGMALKSGGYQLSTWEAWSRRGKKYQPGECQKKWKGFDPSGAVTMGTLVFHAMRAGWKPSLTIDRIPMEDHPAQEFLDKIKAQPTNSTALDLTHLSPIIKQTCDIIDEKSVRPQPLLTLLNVLVFFGALFGRRYQSYTGLRTNIYGVGIAPSTIGKDQSRKTIQDIMATVPGLQQLNGGDSIVSTAGLITLMAKYPRRIIQLDEMGLYLQAVSATNVSAHERQVASIFMQLFSKVQGVWTGAQYADANTEPVVIANPCLCLFGTTTLGAFAKSMKQDAVENGFLNRFVVLEGENNPPFNHEPDIAELHADFVKSIERLYAAVLAICKGTLDIMDSKVAGITPHTTAIQDDAKKFYQQLFEESNANRIKDGDVGMLWGRLAEHSMKIAMINAICRTPEHPVVTMADMRIGESIARRSALFSLRIAREHMHSGEFHKQCQFIESLIRAAKDRGITRSQLTLASRSMNMKGQDVGNVLESLLDSDTIKPFKDESLQGKSGVKATRYFINP